MERYFEIISLQDREKGNQCVSLMETEYGVTEAKLLDIATSSDKKNKKVHNSEETFTTEKLSGREIINQDFLEVKYIPDFFLNQPMSLYEDTIKGLARIPFTRVKNKGLNGKLVNPTRGTWIYGRTYPEYTKFHYYAPFYDNKLGLDLKFATASLPTWLAELASAASDYTLQFDNTIHPPTDPETDTCYLSGWLEYNVAAINKFESEDDWLMWRYENPSHCDRKTGAMITISEENDRIELLFKAFQNSRTHRIYLKNGSLFAYNLGMNYSFPRTSFNDKSKKFDEYENKFDNPTEIEKIPNILHKKDLTGKKPTIIVMVGVPGSGKSVIADILSKEFNLPIVSSDDFIHSKAALEGKNYDEVFEKYAEDAQKYVNEIISSYQQKGESFILDQTSYSRKRRLELIRQFRNFNPIAIYCPIPTKASPKRNLWLKRLRERREKLVPENIINYVVDNITRPEYNEGWGLIRTVDTFSFNYLLKKHRGVIYVIQLFSISDPRTLGRLYYNYRGEENTGMIQKEEEYQDPDIIEVTEEDKAKIIAAMKPMRVLVEEEFDEDEDD